jgi:hypothetical protein
VDHGETILGRALDSDCVAIATRFGTTFDQGTEAGSRRVTRTR